MSAQQALLMPNLRWAVSQGAISLAEAWTFQDLMSLAQPGQFVDAPECLQSMLGRLWLLETEPHNSLPV